MINPLFDDDDEQKLTKHSSGKQADLHYVMPNRHGKTIKPLSSDLRPEPHDHSSYAIPATPKLPAMPKEAPAKAVVGDGSKHHDHASDKAKSGPNPAVDLIRRKLETLYQDEPDPKQEAKEVLHQPAAARSAHQQFMFELSTSGKSLAQIQTEWHNYYINLPDDEKHQVWQEFYSHSKPLPQQAAAQPAQTPNQPQLYSQQPVVDPIATASNMVVVNGQPPTTADTAAAAEPAKPALPKTKKADGRTASAIKNQIRKRIKTNSKAQAKAMQHVKSLLFGLVSGAIVLAIVLFGLFNEMVIAPFIRPSSQASATPIILNTDGVAPSSTPEVIIPKISVQIPVDYSLKSNTEEEVQKGLETGIVHYPTTVKPGEKGNSAFFGHSSNNIFNPGKYKFAFVLLHELVPGDIFYLTYEGKVYSYKVFDKQIVSPSEVGVLNNVEGKQATAVLITCDPPGTALNRLVVWGEQVSPDPSGATEPVASGVEAQPQAITGNGPSLWKRLTGWITSD